MTWEERKSIKIGDLVKWIGFPGPNLPPSKTGPNQLGIVIKLKKSKSILGDSQTRLDVAWGDGSFGVNIYPDTVEVVNEIR